MQTWTPQMYFGRVLELLGYSQKAQSLWQGTSRWTNPSWTAEMTRVLAAAAIPEIPDSRIKVAAKGSGLSDDYGRHEYLTLDVMLYDNSGWRPPVLIVEHENSPSEEKLRYCAWKLLSVKATHRVLVAYIDSTRKYSWCKASASDLLASLRPVISDHVDGDLTIIIGEWCASLDERGWGAVFSLHNLMCSGG